MPFAATPRLKIYFEEAGNGPRLLYIGGVCGDLRSRPNGLTNTLKENFHVLAFDQRGTGQTEKPGNDYSMLDYVEDTVALMNYHDWDNVLVVGVSFGGMVAQELAIRYPERVKAMALACTTSGGAGGSSFPLHELNGLDPETRSRKMMAIGDMRRNEEWQQQNPETTRRLLAESARSASPFLSEPGGMEGFQRQVMARSQHDTYDRLPSIKAPTLICAGRYDGQAKLENIQNLHKQIANSQLQIFEGGHMFLSQDSNAFPAIRDFFLSTD